MNQKTIHEKNNSRRSIQRWLFIYAFCYAFVHIVPAFLEFDIYNRIMVGDLLDLFTPFVLVLVLYKLYVVLRRNAAIGSGSHLIGYAKVILILGSITFVEGHGMHLSANAIARHLVPDPNVPIFALDYFFDEVLGHILWDGGIVLISIGFIPLGLNLPKNLEFRQNLVFTLVPSLLYGFTYFVNAVEGQTVVFTFPMAIILPLILLWLIHRMGLPFFSNTVLCMFTMAYLFAVCLFLIWGVWNGGFPQFSELGWI